jgi:ribosomal protein S12 methylthiotransferase
VAFRRLNRLNELILQISDGERRALIGTELDVMVESLGGERAQAVAVGRTRGQAPDVDGVTYLEGQVPDGLVPGCVVRAKIIAVVGYDLIGELCAA